MNPLLSRNLNLFMLNEMDQVKRSKFRPNKVLAVPTCGTG